MQTDCTVVLQPPCGPRAAGAVSPWHVWGEEGAGWKPGEDTEKAERDAKIAVAEQPLSVQCKIASD